MSTKTKKNYKQSIKNTGSKIKTSAKSYKQDLEKAYNIGYAQGWEDCDKIPSRFGAQTLAVTGYKSGINKRKKSVKAQNKYKKIRGK